MQSITVEELEKTDPVCRYVIDIRPAEYFTGGSFPGAVNLPNPGPETDLSGVPKDKPVYVMCHTGKNSPDFVGYLEENGFDAWDIEGGYRAYVKLQLERAVSRTDELRERTAGIERSLIKTYRKKLWSRFTKAVRDYELIQ
ncbi:MAG: rhodanese-like domain-containing protein, partial [Lachnospiraceae bacterium]|nr:rhodanese-like domain-containing protein [Lachnospiraceae bacterium]